MSRWGTFLPMKRKNAIRAHSLMEMPLSAAASRTYFSSSSDSAIEMVFRRLWSVLMRGRPGGFGDCSTGAGFASPNLRGHASGVW